MEDGGLSYIEGTQNNYYGAKVSKRFEKYW